jgi:sigma-B regulation protein RsbU (phosphoserine phosphatase)
LSILLMGLPPCKSCESITPQAMMIPLQLPSARRIGKILWFVNLGSLDSHSELAVQTWVPVSAAPAFPYSTAHSKGDGVMSAGTTTRILLCADDATQADDVRRLLEQNNHRVGTQSFSGSDTEDFAAYQLVILHDSHARPDRLHHCRRVRTSIGDRFLPVLYLTNDPAPNMRLAILESGADAYLLRPFAAGELQAQVQALLRIKKTHDRLSEKTAELHRISSRLQQAYQQIDLEIDLAQRIQRGCLPRDLPNVSGVRFAVHHVPCGRIGGEFYDVFRLDERHVGFYVADAMSHGVPAGLLSVLIRNGLHLKEVRGRKYQLVAPGDVLQRLNRGLIEQQLSENPFITMAYALLNHEEGILQFARAGQPCPLLIPRRGESRYLQVEGSFLGVYDTQFATAVHPLRSGDKLLLFSDGVDAAQFSDNSAGNASVLACTARHRDLPIQEFIELLGRDLFSQGGRTDDLTLLGVELCG